jgi:hypothetical protein
VSSSIAVYFGTQIIGDANNWPTIVAASSFVGLGVLSTDVYVENGGIGPDGKALEWYINTARFYGQIRNIKIDITAADPGAYVAALHYQVAQATTLENVEIIADSATVSRALNPLYRTTLSPLPCPSYRERRTETLHQRRNKEYTRRMEVVVSCLTSHLREGTLVYVSVVALSILRLADFFFRRWKPAVQCSAIDIQWLQHSCSDHLGLGLGLEEHYSQ